MKESARCRAPGVVGTFLVMGSRSFKVCLSCFAVFDKVSLAVVISIRLNQNFDSSLHQVEGRKRSGKRALMPSSLR